MKPVCVPCQRFFRVQKNGYYFLEGMQKETPALPGTLEPEKWEPYKLWNGDLWRCEGCGTEILSGFSTKPLAQHHEKDFKSLVERTGAKRLQVNDC